MSEDFAYLVFVYIFLSSHLVFSLTMYWLKIVFLHNFKNIAPLSFCFVGKSGFI